MHKDPIISKLEYEEKRKPEIKALADRCRDVSITREEIDAAKTPLPWFKIALKKILSDAIQARLLMADEPLERPDVKGKVMIYTGPTAFYNFGSKSEIELQQNRPLFFPETGGVWSGHIFGKSVSGKVTPYMKEGEETTLREYKANWNIMLADENPNAPTIQIQPSTDDLLSMSPMARLGYLGVRM